MRLSHVAAAYFLMGVIVLGAGVVPPAEVGLAEQFIDVENGGDAVSANDDSVSGEDGLLSNLIGPVRNALDAFVPQLLAVWPFVSTVAGYYAWPITVANYVEAPTPIVGLCAVLTMSMTFGVIRVFRASV
jgi:hypothetical protein